VRSSKFPIVALALALQQAACGGDLESSDPLGELEQAITGGSRVTSNENGASPFGPTVSINDCSGVKIGVRRFLTAIHCISERETIVNITNGLDASQRTSYTVAKVFFHPSFRLGATPEDSIDLGVFEIAVVEITQDTPSIPIARPKFGPVLPGTNGLMLVAYGCDNLSSNGGKKQKALFNNFGVPANLATHVHYLRDSGADPDTCSGDSGGPLFQQINGVWRVVGIVAGGDHFTRIDGESWAFAPNVNEFFVENSGFFMNGRISTEFGFNSLNCLAMDPPPSAGNPKLQVRLNHCDTHAGTFTGKRPGWALLSSPFADHFRIVNTEGSGRCLESEIGGTDATARKCVPSSANHAWRFEDLGLAGPAPTTGVPRLRYFRIVNNASGQCLGTSGSSNVNTDVRMFPCDSLKPDQNWVFHH
jgi:hypothetical protein